MLTTNSCEVDVMLLIDMLTATMLFIQRDNGGCVKFPILPIIDVVSSVCRHTISPVNLRKTST
jgi:hypothetical protein